MRETRVSAARAAALFYDGAAAAVPKMMRPAEGKIPYPYLSPGAQYHGQLWDWDSYWATVAVLRLFDDPETGRRYDRAFRRRFLEHVAGSLRTFFSYQGADGALPINLTPRRGDVFGCTARRVRGAAETNMGKPVFAQMMLEYLRASGDVDFVRQLFAPLKRFHRCWEKRYRHPGTGLFVWGSDVAIGVDDDPTTWGRPPFSSANMLLNNLMYADLSAAATLARRLDLTTDAAAYDSAARRLACAIRTYAWDERDGFFYTVDVQCRRRLALGWVHRNLEPFWRVLPLKVLVWTGFLPLWNGIATREQARRMVREHLMHPERFLSPFGVRALSRDERMYQPEAARSNPSNWLGPVWILANWITWRGLLRSGFRHEAREVSRRIVMLLGRDLASTGTLHEYYSPETGRGIIGPGFWNWNLLAVEMFRENVSRR